MLALYGGIFMSRRSKNKGGSSVSYILLLGILVMAVLAIVGVCIAWVKLSGEIEKAISYFDGSSELKLNKLFDLFGDGESDVAGAFRVMAAFGILTAILSAVTLVLAGVSKVLGWKLFRFLLIVAAVVCVICAVVSIITTFSFCGKAVEFEVMFVTVDLSKLGVKFVPAAGAWLTGIGGALAGLVGIGAALKS